MTIETEEWVDINYKDEFGKDIKYYEDIITFNKDDKDFYKYLPELEPKSNSKETLKTLEDNNKIIKYTDRDTISIIVVRDSNNNMIVTNIDMDRYNTGTSAIEKLQTLIECTNCINCHSCYNTHESILCENTYNANNCIGLDSSLNVKDIIFGNYIINNKQVTIDSDEDFNTIVKEEIPHYFINYEALR